MNVKLLSFIGNIVLALLLSLSCFNASGRNYYINDGFTAGDIYNMSIGDNTKSGLTPILAKESITAVLDAYGPSGDGTLASGDIFYIDAGTYLSLDNALGINLAGISFIGAGSDKTIFDNGPCGSCSGEFFAYITANDVTFQGMTLTRYNADGGNSGKSITVDGATGILLDDVNMISGIDNGDAALLVYSNSEVIFRNGSASCNQTNYGGGIQIEGSQITMLIENCVIANNAKAVSYKGGGVLIAGVSNVNVTISNCTFDSNVASEGGAIHAQGVTLNIANSCFNANRMLSTAPDEGGGICIQDDATVTISNCSFTGNSCVGSADGGAIGVEGDNTTVTITQCYFSGNSSSDDGNALYANGVSGTVSIIVDECIFETSAPSQTAYRTSDGFITITNSDSRIQGSGSSAIGGNDLIQNLGMPVTNCSSILDPCFIANPLPIELLFFTAECNGSLVDVFWSTATEANNDYFILEKSQDGDYFEEIAIVDGAGSSSELLNYSISNRKSSSQPVYYRLSQVDFDGERTVFPVIVLDQNCGNGEMPIELIANLSSNTILVHYDLEKSAHTVLNLIDISGKIVFTENVLLSKNKRVYQSNEFGSLQNGMYFIQLVGESIDQASSKFLVSY